MAKKGRAKLDGFKREKLDKKFQMVKTLKNGGKVVDNGDFDVYDQKGRWLGFVSELWVAEHMASTGFLNNLEKCSELSLWVMWNDAVDSGVQVLTDPTDKNTQFIVLPDEVVMEAKKEEDGWITTLMDLDLFWNVHGDDNHDYLLLQIADEPFRLQ